VFVDRRIADHLIDCDIDRHPAQELDLSEHAPLIVELDLASA
jgi:exonuclease III